MSFYLTLFFSPAEKKETEKELSFVVHITEIDDDGKQLFTKKLEARLILTGSVQSITLRTIYYV